MIHVTNHAVERYAERVRGHTHSLTMREFKAMAADFRRLIDSFGVATPIQPEWTRSVDREWTHWVVVSPDIVCPAAVTDGGRVTVVTVLTRGSLSEYARAKRNRHKQAARAKRRAGRAPVYPPRGR